MITDLLRNDLGKVSKTGSVDVKRLCELQSFEAVHHLVTTIESELKDSLDIFDVLKAVFPGGSITGAPKISAMKIIRDIEPYPRGFYCGSMGYISAHGASDFNIMIRTVTQLGDKLSCHGGGGITVLSDCASEYQECLDKIQKIILSNAGC